MLITQILQMQRILWSVHAQVHGILDRRHTISSYYTGILPSRA